MIKYEDCLSAVRQHNISLNKRFTKDLVFNSNDVDEILSNKVESDVKNERIDYVIITSEELKDSFRPLIEWKITKGLYSKIFTVQEIASKYDGESIQLKIKNVYMICT